MMNVKLQTTQAKLLVIENKHIIPINNYLFLKKTIATVYLII